jgi:hypothetical protein
VELGAIHHGFARRWTTVFTPGRQDGSFGFDFSGPHTKIVPDELRVCLRRPRGVVKFLPAESGVTVSVTLDAGTTHPQEQQPQGCQAIFDNFSKHVMTKENPAKWLANHLRGEHHR